MYVIKESLDTNIIWGGSPIRQKGIDTMANEKKLTKRDKYALLLTIPAVAENEMLVDFISHEVELLSRKNSADKKPSATQTANMGIQSAILEAMAENRLYTVTEIMKEVPACAELTNQKVSAQMRVLVNADLVERIEDKRKTYFRKVAGE